MKKLFIITILIFFGHYTFAKQSKIKFASSNEINELNVSFGFEKITISSDNQGVFTFNHDKPIFVVFEDFSNRYLYLEPGFDLTINKQDNNWNIEGIGAKENNYLIEFGKNNSILNDEVPFVECLNMQPKMFYEIIGKHKLTFDNSIKNHSLESHQLFRNYIDYTIARRVLHFQSENILDTLNNYSLSNQTLRPLDHIDINHQASLQLPFGIYQQILTAYFVTKARTNRIDSLNFNNQVQVEAISNITDSDVKNQFLFHYSKQCIRFIPNKKHLFYSTFISANDDIELKRLMEQYYLESERLGKGEILPEFNFKTLEGKSYSNKDILGKPTYIDIWATWCKPCIADYPKLKEIESKFRDKINFISVIWQDSPERLNNWILNHKPQWIQLISNSNDSFFEKMKITGVPRYILVDKEGRIITPSAKSPETIENQLTLLIK